MDESGVVGHEEHGPVEGVDRGHERVHRLDVEVVCRLVEHEHMRTLQTEDRKGDTEALVGMRRPSTHRLF